MFSKLKSNALGQLGTVNCMFMNGAFVLEFVLFSVLWTVRQNVPGLEFKHTFHINDITNIELFPFSKMPQFSVNPVLSTHMPQQIRQNAVLYVVSEN